MSQCNTSAIDKMSRGFQGVFYPKKHRYLASNMCSMCQKH